jgi:hypothetical protein
LDTTNVIYQKLEQFISKYYTNELIRGTILFIGFGLLYFLFTLFVEYFLWLKPMGRTLLFWAFIGVEVFLLFRFILFPIFKLLKLKKGIGYKEASVIIGSHFSEVKDSLTNFIQLMESGNHQKSELLLASIEQKANSLQPIPFSKAVNFKSNQRYLPLAIIPVFLFAVFYLSGNNSIISQSLNRVVHFNSVFLPPAPFQFVVLNSKLQVEQNQDFILRVKTMGKVVPENAMIYIGDESYFMEAGKSGEFEYKITKPIADISFHLEANSVSSEEYELNVVTVPSIANFEMQLNFPSYLKKKREVVKGTGNAVIPEGTIVSWRINTLATEKMIWMDSKAVFPFAKAENNFSLSKIITQNTEYQIITSNNKVKNHEKLNYQLTVLKDQYPTINVNHAPDSLKVDKSFVLGQISDDYGLSKLQIIYYPKNKPEVVKRGTIAVKQDINDRFVFSFPGNLPVEKGVSYEYYFEVYDNDSAHNFKRTKSSVFSNRVATDEEREDQILKNQKDNINSLSKSLRNQDKQISELDKLQKSGLEKKSFEFKDRQKANDFIDRQKLQDNMMKEFAEKMKDNLDQFKTDKKDEFKDELEKRLDKAATDLEKNQKLLDELKELNDKIKSEDLMEKLDKFKQNSKNQIKNLQQLVELTKKYYVEKKAEQIVDKLEKLSEKQDVLSNKEKENKSDKQNDINKAFDKIQEDLKDLHKENKELKSPMDIPKDAEKEQSIDDDLNKASEELQKDNASKAKPKQKSAAKKMKEMAMKMAQSMEGGEKEQMEEDVKMLRQILDNLLTFSLSQEDLMKQFRSLRIGSPAFNKSIKIQQNLKQQFKHVDDSLFSMSLRNPKITEEVTKEIGNVHYNIDKSLENFSDAQFPKGLSHQQYTISSANRLGDFLSELSNSMKQSLSGMGSGKPKPGSGSGMQLPDIIKKQEGLSEKIKGGMKPGEKPGEGKDGSGNPKGAGNNQNGEDGEGDAKAIMEIYKEQKLLRESLQNELNKKGLGGSGQNALEQMKQIEKQLLNKGFNNESLQKMLNLKYELLKLDTAVQQQGQENRRQSEANKKEFNNRSNALPDALLDYLNSIEILNRQSLPLRSNFNLKVQEYFNKK